MATSSTTLSVQRIRDRRRRRVRAAIPHVVLIFTSLVMIFPFYWSVVMASNELKEFFRSPPPLIPGDRLLINIRQVFTQIDVFAAMGNTLVVACAVTFLVLTLCSLAAFAFAKFPFKGRSVLFGVLILFFMLPSQLGLIPQFLLMGKLHLLGTLGALIIPASVSAFGIFWMRQYISNALPTELLDAATIDGCGFFRQWFHIGLPVMRPGLAFLGLNTFIGQWNDYVWPLIALVDPQVKTLQLALAQLNVGRATDYPVVMAGALIATVPLIIVFTLFARQFVSDAIAGAVKS